MLEPNELRLGNYLNTEQGIFEVETISKYGIDLIQHKDDGSYVTTYMHFNQVLNSPQSFEPIPLTEKWLLDFGFTNYQKSKNREYLNEYGYKFHKIYLAPDDSTYLHNDRNQGWRGAISTAMYDESTGLTAFTVEIKYVHQLQNFYYALTHQELTINKEEK